MAAADAVTALPQHRRTRELWFAATLAVTVLPMLVAVALAPRSGSAPLSALALLLFVGSSVHVGATGWFLTVREVRSHMRAHPGRYLWAPALLVAGFAVLSVTLPGRASAWVLLAFFAWQFHHFQKQNLGVAALAARGCTVRALSTGERRALVASGAGGIAALLGHPTLLQLTGIAAQPWLFAVGASVFVLAVIIGGALLARRPAAERPLRYAGVYLTSLLFFGPVFCFASPYAAVAGLTIAHGLQYLVLVGLLAARPAGNGAPASVGLLMLITIAVTLGVVLNWSSHLHGGSAPQRAVFGVYLGLVSAHFVVDAGLWRLRDRFPRTFLTERLPFLLQQR